MFFEKQKTLKIRRGSHPLRRKSHLKFSGLLTIYIELHLIYSEFVLLHG
jgi:hypothetical protein